MTVSQFNQCEEANQECEWTRLLLQSHGIPGVLVDQMQDDTRIWLQIKIYDHSLQSSSGDWKRAIEIIRGNGRRFVFVHNNDSFKVSSREQLEDWMRHIDNFDQQLPESDSVEMRKEDYAE